MNISEEKLLDFIEGQLDDTESKKVIQALENDPKLEGQYKLLLEGNQLIDAWYKNEIANAPDASITPNKDKEQINKRAFNFWSIIPQLTAGGILSAASLAIVAFIGGNQFSSLYLAKNSANNIDYTLSAKNQSQLVNPEAVNNKKFQKLALLDSTIYRGEKWTKEEWWISNNIALIVRVKNSITSKGNERILDYNGQINKNEKFELIIQTFEELELTIEYIEGTNQPIIIEDFSEKPIKNIRLTPGTLLKSFSYDMKFSKENDHKFIIKTNKNNNKNEVEFLFTVNN